MRLVVFGYAANFHVSDVPTRVYGPDAEAVAAQSKSPVDVRKVDPAGTERQGREALRSQDTGAVVVTTGASKSSTVLIDGSDLFSAQAAASAALAGRGGAQAGRAVQPAPQDVLGDGARVHRHDHHRGLPVTLTGTRVRLADTPRDTAHNALASAGITGAVHEVQATLEEKVTVIDRAPAGA